MTRRRTTSLAVLLAGCAAACGLLPTVEAPPQCGFPPDAAVIWFDDVAPAQAGLADSDAFRSTGSTYVTRDPVLMHDSLDPAKEGRMTDGPTFCFVADGGNAIWIGEVPEGWRPPPGS